MLQGFLSNSTQRTTNYTLAFSTTNVDYVLSNKKGVLLRKVAQHCSILETLFLIHIWNGNSLWDGRSGNRTQIPVAKRSEVRIYGRSLAGVEGSNPAGGMNICVVCCK